MYQPGTEDSRLHAGRTSRSPRAPRVPLVDEARQILVHGMSGAGARVTMMCVGFVLTPYIIVSLGIQDYGVWAVVGALAGYLGLLDFGLGGTFVKFISEHVAKNERDAARQVITFGTLFYLALGFVFAVPVVLWSPAIVGLFKMPADAFPPAVAAFRAFFVLVVAAMALGISGSAVVAVGRMDLAVRNNFIGYLAYACAVAILMHQRMGLTGMVIAQATQIGVTSLLQYATARRLFGPLWRNPASFELPIVRRMFSFGGWTQATMLPYVDSRRRALHRWGRSSGSQRSHITRSAVSSHT